MMIDAYRRSNSVSHAVSRKEMGWGELKGIHLHGLPILDFKRSNNLSFPCFRELIHEDQKMMGKASGMTQGRRVRTTCGMERE